MNEIIDAAAIINPLKMMIAENNIVDLHNQAFAEMIKDGRLQAYQLDDELYARHRLTVFITAKNIVNESLRQYFSCNGTEKSPKMCR